MKIPRLTGWLLVTVLLLVFIALLHPQQLPVSLYKLSLISMAGVAGYWLDRELFPYARPDDFLGPKSRDGKPLIRDYLVRCDLQTAFSYAMLRRAIIVGCAMLAVGLGA